MVEPKRYVKPVRLDKIATDFMTRVFDRPKGQSLVSMFLMVGIPRSELDAATHAVGLKIQSVAKKIHKQAGGSSKNKPEIDLTHWPADLVAELRSRGHEVEFSDEQADSSQHLFDLFDQKRLKLEDVEHIAKNWPGLEQGLSIVHGCTNRNVPFWALRPLADHGIHPSEFFNLYDIARQLDPNVTVSKVLAEFAPKPAPTSSQPKPPQPKTSRKKSNKAPTDSSASPSSARPPRINRDKWLLRLNGELKNQGLEEPLAKLFGQDRHEIQTEHLSALQPVARLDPAQQVRVHALRVLEAVRGLPALKDATAIQVAQQTHGTPLVDPHHLRMVGEAAERLGTSVEDVLDALRRKALGMQFDRESQEKLVGRVRALERTRPESSVFRPRMTNAVLRVFREG